MIVRQAIAVEMVAIKLISHERRMTRYGHGQRSLDIARQGDDVSVPKGRYVEQPDVGIPIALVLKGTNGVRDATEGLLPVTPAEDLDHLINDL